ncbi:right-handed parallel beta-helix repeat-containing protein [Actinoallomurus sp. NPDC052308]|uniref:right-handed parallel beta-helix repeat-containing protein n=1 Tax=Actinoallomurus sp. NPDC052308 TaxID=3155530 RepID=UPI00343AC974
MRSGRGPRRPTYRSIAAAVFGLIALVATGAPALAAPGASGGRTYYVDCAAGKDSSAGTTTGTAWRTLGRVNTATFKPGDSILLRRGTSCAGTLAPQGSGTSAAPIVVGAYGSGARPAINAAGARAAVYLHNVQGWEIRHLDVSDPVTSDGNPRTGIYVLLEDYGTGGHYVVDDVTVHDVTGCDCTDPEIEPSGGVVFRAAGSAVPTGFDGIQVSHSAVSRVHGFGIGTTSRWSRRPQHPDGVGPFVPMSHVDVAGNRLQDLGGSGIVVQNGVDPLIERNDVDGFSRDETTAHSGIYAWNSDGAVEQYNRVTNGDATPFAPAYSIEAASSRSLLQYNYSSDNHGGFVYICGDAGNPIDGATVRYNISQNDRNVALGSLIIPLISVCPGSVDSNVTFYNNVVYSDVADNTSLINIFFGDAPHVFKNNIFVGGASGLTINDSAGVYDHNLYDGIGSVPSGATNSVTAKPLFKRPGQGPDGYRLACGSPAFRAGVAIPDAGDRDFYGFRLQADQPPNIGSYQGPACADGHHR